MKNKEKNFISAVVYVKNSSDTILDFFSKLNKVLEDNFLKYEIIFVNDGSTDDSVEKIKKEAANIHNASISVINMSYSQGEELAMNAGIDLSIGDFVYEFDSNSMDYSTDMIMEVYYKSLEGYDIVNASSNRKRKFTSAIFYKIFNKFSSYQYKIDTESFRIISRRAINRVNSVNKTIPYRKAVLANSGLKMTTLKYNSTHTVKTNYDKEVKRERENKALDSLILFTNASYKFTVLMICIFIFLTLITTIYTVYTFVNNNPVRGWTTTMLFLSFGFLSLFIILAIIIKYLSVMINLIFKKSNYLIESIEKIN